MVQIVTCGLYHPVKLFCFLKKSLCLTRLLIINSFLRFVPLNIFYMLKELLM